MYAVHVNWSKSAAFYDIVYSLSVCVYIGMLPNFNDAYSFKFYVFIYTCRYPFSQELNFSDAGRKPWFDQVSFHAHNSSLEGATKFVLILRSPFRWFLQ